MTEHSNKLLVLSNTKHIFIDGDFDTTGYLFNDLKKVCQKCGMKIAYDSKNELGWYYYHKVWLLSIYMLPQCGELQMREALE